MIENHIAYNVRDIELGCPDDCPRLAELEEKYDELLADWEADRESWQKNYPGEPYPDDLKEPPGFPECDECEYRSLLREEAALGRAAYCGWGSSPQRAYKHLYRVAKHLEEINKEEVKNA